MIIRANVKFCCHRFAGNPYHQSDWMPEGDVADGAAGFARTGLPESADFCYTIRQLKTFAADPPEDW